MDKTSAEPRRIIAGSDGDRPPCTPRPTHAQSTKGAAADSSAAPSNGMANFSVSALPLGTDSIMAIYASGGAFLGSLNGIAQVVVLCGGSLQVTPVANSQ